MELIVASYSTSQVATMETLLHDMNYCTHGCLDPHAYKSLQKDNLKVKRICKHDTSPKAFAGSCKFAL